MLAIFKHYKDIIEFLEPLSNINICDNNGNTSFIIAAANGDLDTLMLLFNNPNNNPHIKNFDGQTALHRACFFGELETIRFLL
jgi:ankyrin repeat protein